MTRYRIQSGDMDVVIEARDEEEMWRKLKDYLLENGPERLGVLIRFGTPRRYRYIETVAVLKRLGLYE
ncbi:MAG: hypothetical protein QXE50_05690 [Nitrososphaerota archaeon]